MMVAVLGQPDTKIFDAHSVAAGMRAYVPGCPEPHRSQIATTIRIQPYPKKKKLKLVVFATAHAYIRHKLTDYESWIGRDGITRAEAVQMIKPELDDIFQEWCAKPSQEAK